MRASPILTAFNAGEISPQLRGRVDLEKYAMGCETMENFFCRAHGGAQRRPGTYFIAEVKDSSTATRLIPFQFNTTQAYVLEFGNQYIRFFKDYGPIEVSGTPYEISSPYLAADLFGIQYVQDSDIMYLVHPEYPVYKLSRTAHTSWTLEAVEFTDGPYLEQNEPADVGDNLCTDGDCELDTGWTPVGAPDTRERSTDQALSGSYCRKVVGAVNTGDSWGTFTTTTNKIYRVKFGVVSTKGQIILYVHKGDNSWGLFSETISGIPYNQWTEYTRYYKETAGGAGAYIAFITPASSDGVAWYVDSIEIYECDTILITPSAKVGTGITLTASAALFEAGHVGAFFRIGQDGEWGYVKITYVTSSTSATADVMSALPGTRSTAEWAEGAFSGVNGYPSAVSFMEQRLVLAGSPGRPQTLWASASGDYEYFAPGVLDDDPLVYTIADKEVNSIRWLGNMSNLIIGTTGAEARLGRQDSDTPITPSNAKITFQSFYGSAPIPGISLGSAILFWERRGHPDNYGERLRELSYNLTYDNYTGVDLTVLAEHACKGGIIDYARQQYPFNILWCARTDGVLVAMTYERDQDVVGWHRHPMTNGLVESVCCIPGANQDDLYMIANRTIGGATKRYIEVSMDFDWGDDQADCFFVDCGLTYDGTEKTITGATKANPVVITAASHGFSDGDHVKLSGVVGMTELNGLEVVVTNKATNTFQCYRPDGLTVNGTAFTTYVSGGIAKEMANSLSGLDHLEGQVVDVLTDGATHPPCAVVSGGIDLEWYAAKAHVGLHYESVLTTVSLEGGSREGTAQGKNKRVHSASVRFYQTLGGKVGPDEDTLETIGFRTATDTYGNPPALFTGDKEIVFPGGWDTEAKITIVQDQPLPMTVLAVMPRFRSEDR